MRKHLTGLIMKRLFKCLDDIEINGKDLKLIIHLFWTQRASIQLEKSLSDKTRIKRGVRQGCVLSPCLFNLYTETVFRHVEDSKGVTIEGTQINNLHYADDTVSLADSEENLQNTINKVNEVGKLYNMKMNAKKTKAMVISRNENKAKVNIKVDGTAVEQVGSFNYLGQTVSDDRRCVDEIKKWIGIAKTTFSKWKMFWNQKRYDWIQERESCNAVFGQHCCMALRHGP